MTTGNGIGAGFPWLDTAIAMALVLALGNYPGLLDIKGLWGPALLGPLGLALLLTGTGELPDSRRDRLTVIAPLGILYGLVTAAPIALVVSWVPKLLLGVEVPYVIAVNVGGIGPLVAPAVRWVRAVRRA